MRSRSLSLARFLVTLAAVIAATAIVADATSLTGLSGAHLGAGRATVQACATAAITVTETGGATISGLTLSGIPAACDGASLTATLLSNGYTRSATGTVPTTGGSMNLTVSPTVPLYQSAQVNIVMSGPTP
jgi:hypothetical protein